jgi:hypothetical protein
MFPPQMSVCPLGFSPPALGFQDSCPCVLFHLRLSMNILFIQRAQVFLFYNCKISLPNSKVWVLTKLGCLKF